MLTYVNILKFLISVACVLRCRHVETQSNHALTGAHVSNQSTNGGVRQQCSCPQIKIKAVFPEENYTRGL